MGSTGGESFASAFGRFNLVDGDPDAYVGDDNEENSGGDKHSITDKMDKISDVSEQEFQDVGARSQKKWLMMLDLQKDKRNINVV